MTTAEQIVTMTVRVPEHIRAGLDAIAEATERTRQHHVLAALKEYIEREEWIIAKIQEGVRAADAEDFATDEEVDAAFARYAASEDRPTAQHAR